MTWEDAIESYKTYLILEKSLSSNSVEAYLNDIKKLAKYCADKHHVTTPDAISYDHLKDYLKLELPIVHKRDVFPVFVHFINF